MANKPTTPDSAEDALPDLDDKPDAKSPADNAPQSVAVDAPSESDYNDIPSYSDGFEGVDVGAGSAEESKPDFGDDADDGESAEDEHKANVVGKSPEEKKAEDEAKKAALEDAAPEPKEGKEAPPAGKEAADDADTVEVEWPEDLSETANGIPDYAQSGWEGDDVGNVEDFDDGDDGVVETVNGGDVPQVFWCTVFLSEFNLK